MNETMHVISVLRGSGSPFPEAVARSTKAVAVYKEQIGSGSVRVVEVPVIDEPEHSLETMIAHICQDTKTFKDRVEALVEFTEKKIRSSITALRELLAENLEDAAKRLGHAAAQGIQATVDRELQGYKDAKKALEIFDVKSKMLLG